MNITSPTGRSQYHPESQLSQTRAIAPPSPDIKRSEVSDALDTIDSNLSRLAESLAVLLQRIEPVLSPICKEEKDGCEICPAPPQSPMVLKLRDKAGKIDNAVRVIQAADSRIQL